MAKDVQSGLLMEGAPNAGNERCGELLRHVVLPAGNLRSALADYVAHHRGGLDEEILTLLTASAQVLDEISQKGRAIASDEAYLRR